MSLPAASTVIALEFVLLLAGLVLLWRQALSPVARARAALLPAWDVSLSDFFLFLCLTMMGGFVATQLYGFYLRNHPSDTEHNLIFGTLAAHAGLLLGIGSYRFAFSRERQPATFSILAALNSGLVTFLIAVPVIAAVTYSWQFLLSLLNYPVSVQDSVDVLRHIASPFLRAAFVIAACVVAPVSEELIFRRGVFRYMRTRVPRWVALLLPALLFAAMHLNFAIFVPLTVLAVIFSLAYERTGNIGTTIVAHCLFNLSTVVFITLGIDN